MEKKMYQEIIDKFKSIKDTLEEDILKIRSFSELFKKLGHSGLKFKTYPNTFHQFIFKTTLCKTAKKFLFPFYRSKN